ncbi:hypothetical protein CVS40_2981 [Lucilia cuprina]|nr:hypothetical protein CVS40_2981 [Lucilia cuprina]
MNLLMIWSIVESGEEEYAVILFCLLTIFTSIILMYGLIQNRHTLLLPWLSNVAVLIMFNIFAVIGQFEEANREVTRISFYLAFGFFMALELQVLFWYIIFTLLKVGHRKTFRVVQIIQEKPEIKKIEDKDTFQIYLVGSEEVNEKQAV